MKDKICAYIEEGVSLNGDITFNGDAFIAGEVKGNLYSSGTLTFSETARVDAQVKADVIIISGRVKGKLIAKSRVEMKVPASFEGSVTAPSFVVQEGVRFKGETEITHR